MLIGDTTNRKNLLLLVQLRWAAVFGQLATIFIVQNWLRIELPLLEMVAVTVFLGCLNMVCLVRYLCHAESTNIEMLLGLLVDMVVLTAQLYLSGGATNPFISLFLLQVILGAILLETIFVWLLVAATSICFVLLTVSFQVIEMPHMHENGFFNLHIQGMFICFLLAVCVLVPAISRITRNLRERDAYLSELRQRLTEEDHIVRLGLLASGAAHELGTPLATLSVILGDWRRVPAIAGDEVLSQELKEMRGEVERCKKIISGILASSGQARGEGAIYTSAGKFFDSAVAEWQTTHMSVTFDYENRVRPDRPMVLDLVLKHALFNILDNAFEASPACVAMSVELEGAMLVIRVSDHGPGFDEAILAHLGTPYTTTKQQVGAGLGLFLAVNVARRLGGSVLARNRPEGGASVGIHLPFSALCEAMA